MNSPESHKSYMRRALELARLGAGSTRPNPNVGAVVVKNGIVVGEGFHARAGGPHAEVEALRQAGEKATGATMYVTLEPCNHHGRTPPCTLAILEAGIRKVHYATKDPNPRVDGGGAEYLRERGAECVLGPLTEDALELNRGFFHWAETGRPWIIAKFAASLDGRIATRTGESQWITGSEARLRGHQLRREVDAILVGVGTVLADDPVLTVRLSDGEPDVAPSASFPSSASDAGSPGPSLRTPRGSMTDLQNLKAAQSLARGRLSKSEPLGSLGTSHRTPNRSEASGQAIEHRTFRIVVDGRGRSPLESKVFGRAGEAVTLVATTETSSRKWRQALRDMDVEVVILPTGRNHSVDLASLLDELGRREIRSVLVEGGATIHGSFFDEGLVNEIWAFIAPIVIGGTQAPGAVGGAGITSLSNALRLDSLRVEHLGKDVLLRGAISNDEIRRDDDGPEVEPHSKFSTLDIKS